MGRVAIFVDAGYLFAAGSTALVGSKQPRSALHLDNLKTIDTLVHVAQVQAPDVSLLRIYWYDGALSFKGPTASHTNLASLDNVKLRLGFINSQGQQKGVDSLIVTDLIDLARNSAISDALLIAGDEDIRIGVQVAQTYGVRVHLVGIYPRRSNQSKALLQEVDTTTEWDRDLITGILAVRDQDTTPSKEPKNSTWSELPDGVIRQTVENFVTKLDPTEFCSNSLSHSREQLDTARI